MKREHIETILWTFMIVVLLLLAIRIDNRGEAMQCVDCTVSFKNKLVGGEYLDYGEVSIPRLYLDYYLRDHCAITWDPVQGYIGGTFSEVKLAT